MSESPDKRMRGWLPFVIVAALLGVILYVAGYFMLSKHSHSTSGHFREFGSGKLARVYRPLGWIECKLSQESVCLAYRGTIGFVDSELICFQP